MTRIDRRHFLALAAVAIAAQGSTAAPKPLVKVHKSPTCGCCGDWIKHLQAEGFEVTVDDGGNAAARARAGIAAEYGSCHTAFVGGYAIEGHVPAREIKRLLRERPQAIGLAVPGMPVGSPGMDGAAYQGRKDPYDVLLLARGARPSVYASYHKA